MYSLNERREMVEIYINCNKNKAAARREFIRRFPGRTVPSKNTFRNIYSKFVNTNTLQKAKTVRRNSVITEDMELSVCLYFTENPKSSSNAAAEQFNISQRSVIRILRKNKYKPYHPLPTQMLNENDFRNRTIFCEQLLERYQDDNHFLSNICWTDEANFSTSGMFNRKNKHHWANGNPHAIIPIKKQGYQTINVWCGIFQNQILGPVFINGSLTGESYLNMLQTQIAEYLDDLPLYQWRRIIWQQDGAPPHNTQIVREFLNNQYDLWIGRNGSIQWPARSPDLTPMDFFLWGALKQKVFEDSPFDDIDSLKDSIRHTIMVLNNKPELFDTIRRNVIKRYNICLENDGDYVKNNLQ